MFEKRLEEVAPVALLANGGTDGKITVADTAGFKVKQQVVLSASSGLKARLEVKRVEDSTTLFVGPIGAKITDRSDVSAFTTALSSTIDAPEQPRPNVPEQEIERLTYEEEPTVARRTVLVDQYGDKIDSVQDSNGINRLAVDGQFTAEVDVQVDVDIDGEYDPVTNPDPDNIGLIGHDRSNPTDQSNQTQRITAKRGTVDTDNVSMDVSLHDQNGNAYTPLNPVPTAGSYEKFFAIIGASKWMELANYDEVVPTFSDGNNTLTLAYMEDGALLGEAVITDYTSLLGWSIKLNRYIDDDDGTPLQDDDGSILNLD